jgi:hypothetical protein
MEHSDESSSSSDREEEKLNHSLPMIKIMNDPSYLDSHLVK